MKKAILLTFLSILSIYSRAQNVLADFESFTLAPNSAYSSTTSVSFSTSNAVFPHVYDIPFTYWSGGFAYTNKMDSSTAGAGNLYGVRALKGYNGSDKYVVGQNNATIKLIAPNNSVDGFYITNTTYAYKSMKSGDQFAKKFGGVSGNDPDYLKITAKGFLGGSMKSDSSVFYLANFTFTNNVQDYIVSTWQFFNTSNLGQVDSIQFFMYSSDMSGNFMNTPAFFALDNFSTSQIVGVREYQDNFNISIFPNPFKHSIHIEIENSDTHLLSLYDNLGKEVFKQNISEKNNLITLNDLNSGIYLIRITGKNSTVYKKIIKE